ncbi:uncharacterized protein LOC107264388 [Cephus cinctus]|uniref:Uncharacterized protein LOC107264388 n=1 Tax=Cephus cinctus TaxID=211228 RepID=A0AAJ7BK49_CEPCN|nr:uncharacterized protein LOC107264388 [Cephus cinctus]
MRLDPPTSTGPPKTKRKRAYRQPSAPLCSLSSPLLSSSTSSSFYLEDASCNPYLSYSRGITIDNTLTPENPTTTSATISIVAPRASDTRFDIATSSVSTDCSTVSQDGVHQPEDEPKTTTAFYVTSVSTSSNLPGFNVRKRRSQEPNFTPRPAIPAGQSLICNTCHADHSSTPGLYPRKRKSCYQRRGFTITGSSASSHRISRKISALPKTNLVSSSRSLPSHDDLVYTAFNHQHRVDDDDDDDDDDGDDEDEKGEDDGDREDEDENEMENCRQGYDEVDYDNMEYSCSCLLPYRVEKPEESRWQKRTKLETTKMEAKTMEARPERSSSSGNDTPHETTTCVDVPGGKFYNSIGYASKILSPGYHDNLQDDEEECVHFSTEEPPRYHDRHHRRRCRSRHKDSTDFDEVSPEENIVATKENDYTARLAKSIVRKRERRRSQMYGEGTGKSRKKLRSDRPGRRCYGLLLVLYLLALPILCATNPSAQVASGFAQKQPPLTHSQNFTQRNSSVYSQPADEEVQAEYLQQKKLVEQEVYEEEDASTNMRGLPASGVHPYNEYTWEVNQINPWLSACDLAGPAPADLQGSCGPPEVPKVCPMLCEVSSRGDVFGEVVEQTRIGTSSAIFTTSPLPPSSTSASSSSSTSSATTTSTRSTKTTTRKTSPIRTTKTNEISQENVQDHDDIERMAPVQCLFYLEESHKRDVCHEEFGLRSRKSFVTVRENRYWFISGLRLRHCCEHAVVNALAPGKGGPLEDVLNGGRRCTAALEKLLAVDALAARLHCEFEEVLARYDCAQPYSVIHNCTHCKEAYRKWVCSSLVPYFAHRGPLNSGVIRKTLRGAKIRPCRTFCQAVEQRCPYLLPGDRAPAYPTQYAGEPTFLCRDPNIPETGGQAERSLTANDNDTCCFQECAPGFPHAGICSNCSRMQIIERDGFKAASAPHCEVTVPLTASTGQQQQQQQRQDAANPQESFDADKEYNPDLSSTLTPLANEQGTSFCGSGGVGSMTTSSSSSRSTQPSVPFSMICLFWSWGVLITLCTGKITEHLVTLARTRTPLRRIVLAPGALGSVAFGVSRTIVRLAGITLTFRSFHNKVKCCWCSCSCSCYGWWWRCCYWWWSLWNGCWRYRIDTALPGLLDRHMRNRSRPARFKRPRRRKRRRRRYRGRGRQRERERSLWIFDN